MDEGPFWRDDGVTETDVSEISPAEEWALIRPFTIVPLRGGGGIRFDYMGPERNPAPLVEHPALFRQFAVLDPTDRDALLAFANAYGQLGVWRVFYPIEVPEALVAGLPERDVEQLIAHATGRKRRDEIVLSDDNRWADLSVKGAETHADWASAICDMRIAVALWDLIGQRDANGLSEVVTYGPNGNLGLSGWFLHDPFGHKVMSSIRPSPASDEWYADDSRCIGVAKSGVPDLGARFLVANWWLMETVNRELWRRVQPDLTLDQSTGSPVLRMYPDDLLRAMWLQFAQAIAGNKQYRICGCGEWFEISAAEDGRTARRMFCTDACKSRDYRKRKSEASTSAPVSTPSSTPPAAAARGPRKKRK